MGFESVFLLVTRPVKSAWDKVSSGDTVWRLGNLHTQDDMIFPLVAALMSIIPPSFFPFYTSPSRDATTKNL
jgi:hypothetical protein